MTTSFTAHLIRGEGLKAGDMNGKSDPFVVIYWEGEDPASGVKSRVVKETLDPEWDEKLVLQWQYPAKSSIIVDVWDKDITSNDYLGRAIIPVMSMSASAASYHLKPRAGSSDKDVTGSVVLSFELPAGAQKQAVGVTDLFRMAASGGVYNSQMAALDNNLDSVPLIQTISDKTGIPKAKLFLGMGVALVLFVVFGYGVKAACNLVGVLYPIFASFKAVKSVSTADDTQWLMYWVVFAFFSVAESFGDKLLFWIPFYYFSKFIFLVWCMHPLTRGASQVYTYLIEPMLNLYEGKIDAKLASATAFINSKAK